MTDWDALGAQLHRFAHPLLKRGWSVTSETTDSDPHCGDSVLIDFQRGSLELELELYDDGRLVAWPLDVPADETSDPLWVVPNATGDQVRARFEESGWL